MEQVTDPGHEALSNLSAEYAFQELHRFREVMCSRAAPELKGKAFAALFLVVSNVDPKDPRELEVREFWLSTADEYVSRNAMLTLEPLYKQTELLQRLASRAAA